MLHLGVKVGRWLGPLSMLPLIGGAYAAEVILDVREYAGLARDREPVVVSGKYLVPALGPAVRVQFIRVADAQGQTVVSQVDERDGVQAGYAASPNGLLDDGDELCFLASVGAGATARYRVFLAEPPAPSAPPDGGLGVEKVEAAGRQPAGWACSNRHLKVWITTGGAIDRLELGGRENMMLMCRPLSPPPGYAKRAFDRAEAVATGPVRAIVRCFAQAPAATGDEAARTFLLYADLPYLAVRDEVVDPEMREVYTQEVILRWKAGGRAATNDFLFMPAPGGTGAVSRYERTVERWRGSVSQGPEFWFYVPAVPACLAPAFFFPPDATKSCSAGLSHGYFVNQDPANVFDTKWGNHGSAQLQDPNDAATGRVQWEFGIWASDAAGGEPVRDRYRALMLYPLSRNIKVSRSDGKTETVIADPLSSVDVGLLESEKTRLAERQAQLMAVAAQPSVSAAWTERARQDFSDEALSGLLERAGNYAALSAVEQWAFRSDVEKWLENRTDPPLSDQQVELLAAGRGAEGFVVAVADNFARFFRTLRGPGVINGPIELAAARREGESVQLGVIPLGAALEGVSVAVGELKNGQGAILSPDAWRTFRVDDVPVGDAVNRMFGKPAGTRWPDVLWPIDGPMSCPERELLPILLTLNVPVDAAPGDYQGTVSVKANRCPEKRLPVRVRVFNFTLPERRTLNWDSWLNLNFCWIMDNVHVTHEQFLGMVELLAGYRAVPGLDGQVNRSRVRLWREKDGQVTYDFSELDRWIAPTQRYGKRWNMTFAPQNGYVDDFSLKKISFLRDRESGEVLGADDFPARSEIDPDYSLLYENFMKAYVAHLKEKGWLATAYLENYDENVHFKETIDRWAKHHEYLKKIVPELRRVVYAACPGRYPYAARFVDEYSPNLSLVKEEYFALYAEGRKRGIETFPYKCGGGRQAKDPRVMMPWLDLWDAAAQRRVVPWMCWKHDFSGFLMFMMNGWDISKLRAQGLKQRWPNGHDWLTGTGTAYLVYPGKEAGTLLPSLRLDVTRDGLEDYEYLSAARERLARRPDPVLEKLLEVDDTLVQSLTVYAHEKAIYDARKRAVGEYIERQD